MSKRPTARSRGRRIAFPAAVGGLLFASVAQLGCGPAELPSLPAESTIYGEADHQAGVPLEPGARFSVVLPETRKALGPFTPPHLYPRADGEVLTFLGMGRAPDTAAAEAEIEGPALIYNFEVIGEGRGKAIVFDAAHRDRFVLRVNAGKSDGVRRTGDRSG